MDNDLKEIGTWTAILTPVAGVLAAAGKWLWQRVVTDRINDLKEQIQHERRGRERAEAELSKTSATLLAVLERQREKHSDHPPISSTK